MNLKHIYLLVVFLFCQATFELNAQSKNTQSAHLDAQTAIYTSPKTRSLLIGLTGTPASITVLSNQEQWSHISGVKTPVWVHKDFIALNTKDNTATVTGIYVNARAIPAIIKGSLVGQLPKNYTAPILSKNDEWYRINADLPVWVKSEHLTPQAKQQND